MKKIIGISLFISGATAIAILTAGLVFYDKTNTTGLNNENTGTNKANGKEVVLSSQEIARHDNLSDCWLVISGKVYDVTAEINLHPGGSDAITAYCGKDATNAFATQNKNPAKSHSSEAKSLLANYYLGDSGQTINQRGAQQQIEKKLQANPDILQQDDDEEDEDESEDG